MGKRSNFLRKEKDFYGTVDKKVLVDVFLRDIQGKTYAEPCWGEGDLEDLLRGNKCLWRSDLRDTSPMSKQMDGLKVTPYDVRDCDLIVTNPPFSKDVLLPLIDHWITLKPTWLLLPADLMHNKYFGPYMEKCAKVISIGRICWFPAEGKRVASTDNFCWYFWEKDAKETATVFVGK